MKPDDFGLVASWQGSNFEIDPDKSRSVTISYHCFYRPFIFTTGMDFCQSCRVFNVSRDFSVLCRATFFQSRLWSASSMRTATWNQVFIAIVSRQRQCKFIGDTSNWLERSTRDVLPRFYAAYLSHESKLFTRALFQTNFQILHRSEKKAKKIKKLFIL